MSLIDGIRHRIHVLFRREAYMREVERELRFHAELATLADSRDSDDRLAAELAGRKAVGNATYYREEVRRMTMLRWLDRARQDASYAMRGLKHAPAFTTTVVVTLALGFGVNAAMYTMLDQVYRRAPEGVVAPGEVRRLYMDVTRPKEPGGRHVFPQFEFPAFRAISGVSPVALAAFTPSDSVALVRGETRTPVRESMVTGKYFSILGLRPQLGRFFVAEEDSIQTPTPVCVLSDALWRREFAADRGVLGKTVTVDHHPVTIIGVAPPNFTGVDLTLVDVWLPANMIESFNGMPGPWYESFGGGMRVITRVRTSSDEVQLTTAGAVAMHGVHIRGFEYDSTSHLFLGPITEASGPMKPAQEVVVATRISWIAMIVLIIACANVTNLLLLRASRRKREISVRRALGASQMRLYQQLAIESTLLALLGGTAALVVAFWVGNGLRGLMLPRVHWAVPAIDGHTVVFLLGLSMVIGLGAGLAPAFHAMRPNLTDSLKAGTREGAYQRSSVRATLLVLQTMLCVVLLVGAGLFLRSLDALRSIDVGYRIDDVITVTPSFVTQGRHKDELTAGIPLAAERIARIDGAESVAYALSGPMQGSAGGALHLPGRDSLPRAAYLAYPSLNAVSPEYFRVVGLPIREGREFTPSDRGGPAGVVIVSQAMARLYWPGTTALGKCLIIGERTDACSIVVGVSADVHLRQLIEQPALQYFVPATNSGWVPGSLIIRSRPGRAAAVAHEAQRILAQTVSGTDGAYARQMSDVLEPQLRPWRLGATLFTAFGVLALAVAGIGIYSVVAYGVSQRTNEMGIRVALGAQSRDILDLVVGEGVRLLGIGIVLGVVVSLALGRFIGSLLFGIMPNDASVLIGAASILIALGLLACVVPAWRATRVNPVTALRAD
jgi:predicted permease